MIIFIQISHSIIWFIIDPKFCIFLLFFFVCLNCKSGIYEKFSPTLLSFPIIYFKNFLHNCSNSMSIYLLLNSQLSASSTLPYRTQNNQKILISIMYMIMWSLWMICSILFLIRCYTYIYQ